MLLSKFYNNQPNEHLDFIQISNVIVTENFDQLYPNFLNNPHISIPFVEKILGCIIFLF